MPSMSYGPIDNDDSELGKMVKQTRTLKFQNREKANELYLKISEGFEKNGDYWNAAWYYRTLSDSMVFGNKAEDYLLYLEKSLGCFRKVKDSENEDKIKRAISALITTHYTGRFSSIIDDTLSRKIIKELNEFAANLLLSVFYDISDEEKKLDLLFKGIECDFSNVHMIYGTGLFRLLTEIQNFQLALELTAEYENKLYYDDKAWLYVSKAYADKSNAHENLEKAVELFLQDTHENFQTEGMKKGRRGWTIGSATLWANFFKGQALLLQNVKTEKEMALLLKEASSKFKEIEKHHFFPTGTFLAILCEGLANFLETKDEKVFENLHANLSKLIGMYAEGDEKKITQIISALNKGFEACKNNRETAAIENPDLKNAIASISSLDNWALQNVFGFTKKTIAIQASCLLAGKSGILEKSIQEFEKLLNEPKIIEEQLQGFLTNHHFLFGPEYQEVIPKHRLGSEYVMDYALRTYNDVYHLVEIERSTHKLYNKNGDPSAELIHAEQQILDWLAWIEKNSPYARENLPTLMSPKGFVIIGRSRELDVQTNEKLRRRNATWGGKIEILTYDNLLNKAKTAYANIKEIISG